MTERFSGIKALKDWLFRGRRITDVLPAAELELPKGEQSLLNDTNTTVLESPDGKEKRRLRKASYDLEHRKGGNNNNPDGQGKRAKKGRSQNRPEPGLQEQKESIEPVRRGIVVEKVVTSLNLNGLNDERLLTEIRRSKSEIPEREILGIIGKLQTDPVTDLVDRHKKRVHGGPFKGYHEVRRGKAGRVLFSIDQENVLHLRLGNHDHIYATRTSTRDPARSL